MTRGRPCQERGRQPVQIPGRIRFGASEEAAWTLIGLGILNSTHGGQSCRPAKMTRCVGRRDGTLFEPAHRVQPQRAGPYPRPRPDAAERTLIRPSYSLGWVRSPSRSGGRSRGRSDSPRQPWPRHSASRYFPRLAPPWKPSPPAANAAGVGTSVQLTAFFTSALILASSAAVNLFNAKDVGHMSPSSRLAACWKPNVAYLDLNFCALWKKQTTLPSLA